MIVGLVFTTAPDLDAVMFCVIHWEVATRRSEHTPNSDGLAPAIARGFRTLCGHETGLWLRLRMLLLSGLAPCGTSPSLRGVRNARVDVDHTSDRAGASSKSPDRLKTSRANQLRALDHV